MPWLISRFLGKSYSFTAHAADIYTRATLVREKIDNANFVITVSQYNKQHLLKVYPRDQRGKDSCPAPWVDLSQFVPLTDRPDHERLQILSVGRLVEKKGHLDLIDACYFLRQQGFDIECRIVGDGPLYVELKERIANHDLKTVFICWEGDRKLSVMLLLREWADVFVLPCVIARNGDRDGIPVSLAEAMAMELPVISTDIVGIGELVQPGTGILVPPHDPAALADALRAIAIQDRPAKHQNGTQGTRGC